MPDRLLAIDVGRTIGWAAGQLTDPYPLEIGSRSLPTSSVRDLVAARLDAFDTWLTHSLPRLGTTLVVMAERFHVRNTGEAAASFSLDGLVRLHCYRRRIPLLVQPENTVRKEILGRGGGTTETMKQLALGWCQGSGLRVANDHEADACVLWVWACRELIRTTRSGQRDGDQQQVVVGKKRKKVAQKPASARLKAAAVGM